MKLLQRQICINNLQIFTLGKREKKYYLMKLPKNLDQSFSKLNIKAFGFHDGSMNHPPQGPGIPEDQTLLALKAHLGGLAKPA